MKIHINKHVARLFSAAVLASSLTACDDFLSIIPLNDVVLENYWTEEADVTSVVNSCYAQLESADCLKRMIVWGELRSDNLIAGSGAPQDVTLIAEENLLETNGYTKWDAFYQCINRCNTVLHYAPSVHEKDPNYTESELRANIAEVTALRALCYFYLIRTFRDVPYVTEPSIDDTQNYRIPATKFDEVLTNLINDLERVKNDAVRSYGESLYQTSTTSGDNNINRITRYSIYALLADMYLWQGNYQQCIDYCNLIIEHKKDEYETMLRESRANDIELYGEYPLISEAPGVGNNYVGTAYSTIFGDGNSFESIFELIFLSSETKENVGVKDFYGTYNGTGVGQMGAPAYLCASVESGTNNYFERTDMRAYEYMEGTSSPYRILKYVRPEYSAQANFSVGTKPTNIYSSTTRGSNTANWIVYRLTDIMLMKAEAEVMLAGNVEVGATLTPEQEAHYRTAFSCVSAVWKRANNKRTATTDTLVFEDYGISRVSMEDLVLNERQRELMFEGKRWFDLVRLCRREGSNSRMVEKVLSKFEENTAALRIRLSATDALYWPYNESEMRANPYLVQNPAYENENITTTE